jgi:hypothetical protein
MKFQNLDVIAGLGAKTYPWDLLNVKLKFVLIPLALFLLL